MALESYMIPIGMAHGNIVVDTLTQVPLAGQLVLEFDTDRPWDTDFVECVNDIVEAARQTQRQSGSLAGVRSYKNTVGLNHNAITYAELGATVAAGELAIQFHTANPLEHDFTSSLGHLIDAARTARRRANAA